MRRFVVNVMAVSLLVLSSFGAAHAFSITAPLPGATLPSGKACTVRWVDPGAAVSFTLQYSSTMEKTGNR